MSKNNVNVNILGSSFTIQSEDNAEYLSRVIEDLKKRIATVQSSYPTAEPKKVLILTALNLVDEVFKLKDKQNYGIDKDIAEISKITEELIYKLEDSIDKVEP